MIVFLLKEMGRLFIMGFCSALTLLAAGCERAAPVTDADLEHLADYQRARKAADSGDSRTAAALYNRVVRTAPDAARPHLELGLLYDEKLGDPLAAIYHYRQYLELDPKSERRQVVEDYIERAKIAYAAGMPQSPGIDPGELTRLQNENAALRVQIAELAKPAPPAPSEPVADPVKPRTHVVQKGDTLQSLALRYYGTRAAWEKIYAANRTILPSKDQLKIGQELTIP
jgi:tetratricopeptide (TPR) repeat protein